VVGCSLSSGLSNGQASMSLRIVPTDEADEVKDEVKMRYFTLKYCLIIWHFDSPLGLHPFPNMSDVCIKYQHG